MIIALTIFLLTLAGKLAIDTRLYLSGKKNRHKLGPAIVFVLLILCSWLAGWLSAPMWFFGFWVGFDMLYGTLIGQGPWFIGTTAKIDILQRKYPLILVLKYMGFLASPIIYFYA